MSTNSRTCICSVQQYDDIVMSTPAYQNSANTVYNALSATLTASTNGTLGSKATGAPIFKSDYERMQYLLGRQRVANCGVKAKAFPLGTN